MKICTLLLLAVPLAIASAQTYTFTSLGEAGHGNADGTGSAARFAYPSGVAVDRSGNVYVADTGNNAIRKITATGVVTTVAGLAGSSGSADGLSSAARFSRPAGLAVDASGNLYISDTGNHTLRKITADGRVMTLAGAVGSSGSADGTGSVARFNHPTGVAVDGSGNVFVADTLNGTIRKITPEGVVTTLTGAADLAGRTARFGLPLGVAVDGAGNVFVADYYYKTAIRVITAGGVVTTLPVFIRGSSNADDIETPPYYYRPYGFQGVAVDGNGNVFVADGMADGVNIRGFGPPGGTITKFAADGVVTSLAGSDSGGSTDGTGNTARFSSPTGVAVDGSGNVYVADRENHTIRKITGSGVVTTLAGDATAIVPRPYAPNGVAADGSGNVFVADTENHSIRKIAADGITTTLAGTAGMYGSADGTGRAAQFHSPTGVAVDGNGNVFVADGENHTIRKITADGVVTTLAGTAGSVGSGDGIGTAARFNYPLDLAVDGSGNVFVSDTENHTIRKITANGVVTTLAGAAGSNGSADGTGADARFYYPRGLAVDLSGNVFVADADNETIRKITAAGIVSTLAGAAGISGSADGAGSAARFNFPRSVAVDNRGNVFVADAFNHTIRKITAAGVVSTLAGMAGSAGSADGAGSMARFSYPRGVAVDGSGNLFVADRDNHTIRKGVPVAADLPASRLVNFSVCGFVPAGGDLTVGFVVRGSVGKSVLARAVGPTLRSFGVSGTLSDPRLEVIAAGENAATSSNSNDDWDGSPFMAATFASVGAFPLLPFSKDAAVLGMLPVGGHTVRVTSGLAGESGMVLAELYDRDPPGAANRLGNLSTLGFVGNDAPALTLGFVIEGAAPKRLLIRAVGPGLAPFGVTNVLSDPQLAVFPAGKTIPVASNDNWGGDVALSSEFNAANAFLLPAASKDAAVVVWLTPGSYTVTVSGVGATGRTLVEIYDLDP